MMSLFEVITEPESEIAAGRYVKTFRYADKPSDVRKAFVAEYPEVKIVRIDKIVIARRRRAGEGD